MATLQNPITRPPGTMGLDGVKAGWAVSRAALAVGACVPVVLASQTIFWRQPAPPQPDAKAAIERAAAFVAAKGDAWIKERKCVSCHMIPFMIWSLNEADAAGYDVPGGELDGWTQWTLDDARRESPGLEGLARLILARSAKGRVANEARYYERYAKVLLEKQRADGTWSPGGQTPDQKRPPPETKEVVAMWTILALDDILGDAARGAIQKARGSIGEADREVSTEWLSLRLLVAQRLGEPGAASKQLDRLLRTQNKDGGWGWKQGEESDALATGQSLYALSGAPSDKARRPISRARDFLLKTQRADGSWAVKSTLAEHRGAVRPTSVFWGTTWAVIGLCRTASAGAAESPGAWRLPTF